jgi:hypothetical protein
MRVLLVGAALIASSLPAVASGSLDCSIKDKSVQIELHSGITRGMGGPFFDFKAELKTSLPSVPKDLQAVTFEMEHLAQRWLDDREAKLVVYREREGDGPHGSVEMTIETKRIKKDDEGFYAGTYVLEINETAAEGKPQPKPVKLRGRITCSAG